MPPYVLSASVGIPLVAGIVLLRLGDRHATAARAIGILAAGANVLLAAWLWFAYDPAGLTWQFTEQVPLVAAIGFAYSLGTDGFGILLVLVASAATALAVILPWERRPARPSTSGHLLLLESAALAVFTALDLLLFVLAWTAALAVAWQLLREEAPAGTPGPRVFAWHAAGSTVALAAAVIALHAHVYWAAGVRTFDLAQTLQLTIPGSAQAILFVLFFVAFAVVMPLFPFVTWVAGAHARAPAAARVQLGAVLLKLGIFGIVRVVLPLFPQASARFGGMVTSLAAITIVLGGAGAMRQSDWRRALGYASAAFLGMTIITLFRLTPVGLAAGMLQQAHHGVLFAAAFAAGGLLTARHAVGSPVAADEGAAPPHARRPAAVVLAATAALGGWSILAAARVAPSPLYPRIETSAGRVAARVNPAYAPVVRQPSDCAAPQTTVTPSADAPGGWVMAAPCETPSAAPAPEGAEREAEPQGPEAQPR